MAYQFQVGDKVIGNDKAGELYGRSGKGWRGMVVKVYQVSPEDPDLLWVVPDREKPLYKMAVRSDCFDLVSRDGVIPDLKSGFLPSLMTNGLFGCMNDGTWFVVVDDRLVYFDKRGGFDFLQCVYKNGELRETGRRIDFLVDAYSLRHAKGKAHNGEFVWIRPGVTFKS